MGDFFANAFAFCALDLKLSGCTIHTYVYMYIQCPLYILVYKRDTWLIKIGSYSTSDLSGLEAHGLERGPADVVLVGVIRETNEEAAGGGG